MKKLASLILALAMCLALGAPAFATTSEGEMSTDVTPMLPTLDITFPPSATILMNPYRMQYTGTGTPPTGIDATDRLQVMNAVFSVESKTLSSVKVTATFTGTTEGDATLVASPVLPGDTGKNVNLLLTYVVDKKASANVPSADATSSNVVKISDSEQEVKWTLPPATKSGSTTTPQRIDMQFSGTCSDAPQDSPWSDSDTVGCSIAFEAIPVTDIPQIAVTYQLVASGETANDLEFDTGVPVDFKSTPKVTNIEYGALNATTLTAVTGTLSSVWSTKADKVTLKAADLATALAAAGKQKLLVTLTYTDNSSSTGVTQTIQYELKVTVLAVPT